MRFLALAIFLVLAACSGRPSLDDPQLSDQALNLEEYFSGSLVARGQFQDVFGTVRRRFDVQIEGEWDGQTLTLVEDSFMKTARLNNASGRSRKQASRHGSAQPLV